MNDYGNMVRQLMMVAQPVADRTNPLKDKLGGIPGSEGVRGYSGGSGTRTRDSTWKHEVVHVPSGTTAITNLSRTEANKLAKEMAGDRPGSFLARPVKK
jgi:hypothetical protein